MASSRLWRLCRSGPRTVARHSSAQESRATSLAAWMPTRHFPMIAAPASDARASWYSCRPAQVLAQKLERANAVNRVRAVEIFDRGALGNLEIGVQQPHLGVLIRHTRVGAHAVTVAALDHE